MRKLYILALLLPSLDSISQTIPVPVTQVTANMGGGTAAVSANFLVDWSIGESTIIETFDGQNTAANYRVGIFWNVTSGILQPFDKNILYNFLLPTWASEEIHLYPIPTTGVVNIDFKAIPPGKISMQLFTLQGRLIGIKEFNQTNGVSAQKWDLTHHPSGAYHIRIQLSSDLGIILKQGAFTVIKN
jgi:hypothetical protein